jgi:hypothetical protein
VTSDEEVGKLILDREAWRSRINTIVNENITGNSERLEIFSLSRFVVAASTSREERTIIGSKKWPMIDSYFLIALNTY